MTSNAGTSVGSASGMGFLNGDNGISVKIAQTLKEIFRPEFLNRVDEVIEFSELTKEELKQICSLMLKDMISELKGMGIGFEISDEAKDILIDRGYKPKYGARPIRREIQTSIEDAVSAMILGGDAKRGSVISADAKDEEIVLSIK